MAKISVIIPLYNKAKFIKRAIDSVLAQSFHDFEIIVVNDGSTDDGPEIVESFNDNRLRIVHQANAGPGAARNKGISESKAPFLAFLDADDEWMPQYLEKSLNSLESAPDCDLTACTYFLAEKMFDVTPIWIKQWGMKFGPWRIKNGMSSKERMCGYYMLNSWAILCRRQVVQKFGGFRTRDKCNYGEDTFLWIQAMFNHQMFMITEPLVWYHSEASQLGPGRKDGIPLPPFLTDPDPIRASCRTENKKELEKFLAQFALSIAHDRAAVKAEMKDAEYLVENFPGMKNFPLEYAKLRIKMKLPELIPAVRFLKKVILLQHS